MSQPSPEDLSDIIAKMFQPSPETSPEVANAHLLYDDGTVSTPPASYTGEEANYIGYIHDDKDYKRKLARHRAELREQRSIRHQRKLKAASRAEARKALLLRQKKDWVFKITDPYRRLFKSNVAYECKIIKDNIECYYCNESLQRHKLAFAVFQASPIGKKVILSNRKRIVLCSGCVMDKNIPQAENV